MCNLFKSMEEERKRNESKQSYIENKANVADFKPNHTDSYFKGKWPKYSTKRQKLSNWIKKKKSKI